MLNFFGSVINFMNVDKKTNDIIKNTETNKKISREVFEPILEDKKWFTDKNIKKRNEKINQRSYEQRIKKILSNYFQTSFVKIRPEWLKNPLTNRNLELDIYSPELNIAIEYQGAMHTKFVGHFHKSKQEFENQVIRDMIKSKKCKERGIKLVCIHHYEIPPGNDVLDSEILDIILEKMSKII